MEGWNFLLESNAIEGIYGDVPQREVAEYDRFMALEKITLNDVYRYVMICSPKAVLRDLHRLDVEVGSYRPPKGSPYIRDALEHLIESINDGSLSPYRAHCEYESLHPFTDGNGRSGRMIWMWMMREAPLGFLHTFYYQSLDGYRLKK